MQKDLSLNFGKKTLVFALVLACSLPSSVHAALDSSIFKDSTHYDESFLECGGVDGGTEFAGGDIPKFVFQFLTDSTRGFTDFQAAGIMGNLKRESGIDPTAIEDLDVIGDDLGPGHGLAQWTNPINPETGKRDKGRWTNLQNYASERKKPWTDLGVQLDFLWLELNSTETKGRDSVKASKTVEEATEAFERDFERAGVVALAERIQFAKEILDLYGGGGGAGAPASGASGTTECADTEGGNGVVAGDIVKTALGLAWPDDKGHTGPNSATPAYKAAWNKASDMTDCGAFVATVMVKSGVDPNYPPVHTGTQKNYLESNKEKYHTESAYRVDTSKLRAGDILIFDGHTMIYVGPQPGGYLVADASLGDHTPMLSGPGNLTWMLGHSDVILARVLK